YNCPLSLHDALPILVERVDRSGISCGRVRFELPHEHTHRHLRDVLEIVDRSNASDTVKEKAAEVFRRLAAAEAAVHGTTIEKVQDRKSTRLNSSHVK